MYFQLGSNYPLGRRALTGLELQQGPFPRVLTGNAWSEPGASPRAMGNRHQHLQHPRLGHSRSCLGLRRAKHRAAGRRAGRIPAPEQAIPPEGLVSAGTSGRHRRLSLGGSSPLPLLAKTCDPNIDLCPRSQGCPLLACVQLPQGWELFAPPSTGSHKPWGFVVSRKAPSPWN